MRRARRRDAALAIGSGLALAAAFPKVGAHPLVWCALVPALLLVRGRPTGSALWLGWLFGAAFRAATLYWLVGAMTRFGGLSWPLAVAAAALLVGYLACYPALALGLSSRADVTSAHGALLAAAAWVGGEWLQGWLLTGFPWALLGYPAGHTALLVQVADVAGVWGLSFLALLVNAALAAALVRRRALTGAGVVGVLALAAAAAYGAAVLSHGPPAPPEALKVGIVQGNVAQELKWDPAAAAVLVERHLGLTRAAAARGARLIVWPESSWPDPYGIERDARAVAALRALAAERAVALLVGTVHVERGAQGWEVANSALLVRPDGGFGGRYDKVHLVPFGEYLPLRSLLRFLGPMVRAVGQLRPGDERQPLLAVPEARLGPLAVAICYEIVFPAEVRARVRAGARLLVTMTNDAWYGRSSGPYQHFDMARMRAVETRRYLVRAANTGISGIVDPWGRVLQRSELETQAVLVGEVRQLGGTTLYLRFGDAFAVACAIGSAAAAFVLRRRLPGGPAPR